ncbi:MAG: hypothetical protein ACUVV0_01610, partial [Anaerolineae bacterium]
PTPTDTPTDTPIPTDTPTDTPTSTYTPTDTPTATDTPTETPTPIPVPALVSPADGTVIGQTRPLFDWSDISGAAGYNIQIDTGVYTVTATSEYTPPFDLTDGPHSWTVRAYDDLGYYSLYTDTWTFTIDTSLQMPSP